MLKCSSCCRELCELSKGTYLSLIPPKHPGTSTEYYSLTEKIHHPTNLSQFPSMFTFLSAGITNPPLLELDPCKVMQPSGFSQDREVMLQQLLNVSRNVLLLLLCVHCGLVGTLLISHSGTQSDKDSLLIHASMITMARGKNRGKSCADSSSFHPEVTPLFCSYFLGQSWAYTQV